MTKGKAALGKGLSALIGEQPVVQPLSLKVVEERSTSEVAIDLIQPGPFQPRRLFVEEHLQELADSIRQSGVLQPLIVRQQPQSSDRYQLIAGERRWRAAKLAGLTAVPVVVKSLDDKEALEIALIENIQRQDLTPIEEAQGYQQLIDECGYTQEVLGVSVGKSRSHIANLLRLLSLPEKVKALVNEGTLSMGHARALVNAQDAEGLADQIVREGLNVRQTEKLVQAPKRQKDSAPKAVPVKSTLQLQRDDDVLSLEKTLSECLGMRVRIEDSEQGGKVTIFFHNLEQLDAILQRLGGNI